MLTGDFLWIITLGLIRFMLGMLLGMYMKQYVFTCYTIASQTGKNVCFCPVDIYSDVDQTYVYVWSTSEFDEIPLL